MTWTTRFLLDLQQGRLQPRFLLEDAESTSLIPGGHRLGGQVRLSSHDVPGPYWPVISPERSGITHGQLTPGEWTRTQGSLRLGLALRTAVNPYDDYSKRVRSVLRRGMLVRLLVGFEGYAPADYQPVWLGVVKRLSWSQSGGWTLQCTEIVGGLTQRLTTLGSTATLFSGLTSTTLGADYTALDDPVTLTSGTGIEHATGERTCLLVTPTTGAPFYLVGTLSGASLATISEGYWNTTAVDAVTGDTVQEVAYTVGHPLQIARRILTSTGIGGNGPDDTLPERWGMAISADLVDRADIEHFRSLLGSQAYSWDLRVTEEQPDGLRWLEDWLRAGGFFLSQHQGRITVRAIVDPTLATPTPIYLDDSRIGSIDGYETWDSDTPIEYATWRVTWGDQGTTQAPDPVEDPSGYAAWVAEYGDTIDGLPVLGTASLSETDTASRPVLATREWEAPDVWRVDHTSAASADAQVTAWANDIPARLYQWETRIAERLEVTCAGLHTAYASIGDQAKVTIDPTILSSRFEGSIGDFDRRPGIILGGGPDWFRGVCQWSIGFVPPLDEG